MNTNKTYRKDVFTLAERLSEVAGIDADHVYFWLMKVGKDKGVNPRLLPINAISGMVYLEGNIDNYRLESYKPPLARARSYAGPDYEALILERQEKLDWE